MTEQPELEFSSNNRGIESHEVDLLLWILGHASNWMTADAIVLAAARHGVEWSDRFVRAVAGASSGQVLSYPGSPGYKLTLKATPEEVAKARQLLSQADEMRKRYLDIEWVYHHKRAKDRS